MKTWIVVVCAWVVWGCGSPPDANEASVAPKKPTKDSKPSLPKNPSDPDEALYEVSRKGTVQMNGAADTIEETLATAEKVKAAATGEAAAAMEDVLGLIDSAGAGIADYTAPIPNLDEFRKVVEAQDERRLKAIEAGNDAVRDLKEAVGILDSLAENSPEPLKKGASELSELVDLCIRDLYDAVEALGGQIND